MGSDVFADVTDVKFTIDVLRLQSADLLQDLELLEDLCRREVREVWVRQSLLVIISSSSFRFCIMLTFIFSMISTSLGGESNLN